MNSSSLIILALKILKCTQKDLAKQLNVSPAQISKWKSDEYMSYDMEKKLSSMIDIGDLNPDVVLWTGGIEQASKWDKLVKYLAECASQGDETGYITYPLIEDDCNLLCWNTLYSLKRAGIEIPPTFPTELDFDYSQDEEEPGNDFSIIDENPYSALIYKMYTALTDIYGFYAAYIKDLMNNDELDLYDTRAVNIESCLIDLALCKVGKNSSFMPNFTEYKYNVLKDYEDWIKLIKEKAFQMNIPLKAELMNLIFNGHDELGHEAEAESLGFNSTRLHPDIYMNEILESHRVIHQVLPVICKKLGITEEELAIDHSKLHLG